MAGKFIQLDVEKRGGAAIRRSVENLDNGTNELARYQRKLATFETLEEFIEWSGCSKERAEYFKQLLTETIQEVTSGKTKLQELIDSVL